MVQYANIRFKAESVRGGRSENRVEVAVRRTKDTSYPASGAAFVEIQKRKQDAWGTAGETVE